MFKNVLKRLKTFKNVEKYQNCSKFNKIVPIFSEMFENVLKKVEKWRKLLKNVKIMHVLKHVQKCIKMF